MSEALQSGSKLDAVAGHYADSYGLLNPINARSMVLCCAQVRIIVMLFI